MADEPSWFVQPTEDETWDVSDPEQWTELAAMTAPGSGAVWSRDDASASIVGHIPSIKEYDAVRKIVGYCWADEDEPWALHRVNPMTHPRHPQMRCVTVDSVGYNPCGVEDESEDEEEDSTYTPSIPSPVAGTFPRTVNYTRQLLTVKMRPHPFAFRTDEQMVALALPEYYRNCVIFDTCEPLMELLSANTAAPWLKWKDEPTGGDPPVQESFEGLTAQGVPEIISKANLVIAWMGVPLDFVARPYIPSKIMACVGKVNDEDNWLAGFDDGFPRGTLKLEAPKFKKSQQGHIRTSPAFQLPEVVDIFLPFSYFDPTPAPVTGEPSFRGHNLMPFSQTGKYYSVARSRNDSQGPFEYTSFDDMFTHVLS